MWDGVVRGFGFRSKPLFLAGAVACALQALACGSHTGSHSAPLDGGPGGLGGAAGAGGLAGAGGSSAVGGNAGGGGRADPRCDTLDDGAEVLADDLVGIRDPRVDATHLFHPFHAGGPDVYVIRIYKLGLEIGAPLEEINTSEGAVVGFALDEQHVWWSQRPTLLVPLRPDRSEWKLFRVDKNGGSAEVILPDYVQAITPSSSGLVVMRASEDPESISGVFQLLPWSGGPPAGACEYEALDLYAANDTIVAWINFRRIETCPLVGGPPRTLLELSPPQLAQSFAVDSTHAFWSASGLVHRVPLAGGELETVATYAAPSSRSHALVLDGTEVFYQDGPRIVRVPKGGGTPREAVPPQTGPIAFFTVNATHVYWGEGNQIICLKRKLK